MAAALTRGSRAEYPCDDQLIRCHSQMTVGARADQISLYIQENLVIAALRFHLWPTSRGADRLCRETEPCLTRKITITTELDLIERFAGREEPVLKPFAQDTAGAHLHC